MKFMKKRRQELSSEDFMKNILRTTLCLIPVFFLTSCSRDAVIPKKMEGSRHSAEREKCMGLVSGERKGLCRPNIHFFFANPGEFTAESVSVLVFATYSTRGSLLIYPSLSQACDAVDYSAMEVFVSTDIPLSVKERLYANGVARILVNGKILGANGNGALPVVGSIRAEEIVLLESPAAIILENPVDFIPGPNAKMAVGQLAPQRCIKERGS